MTDQHTQAGQNQQYRAEWLPGFGISRDYALCDSDATHIFHLAGSYELPFGHGHAFLANNSKAVDAVLGGWVVNFIYSHQSGQPFTVTCPTATTADFGCFANVVPGQSTVRRTAQLYAVAEPRRFRRNHRRPRRSDKPTTRRLEEVRSRRAGQASPTWIRRS